MRSGEELRVGLARVRNQLDELRNDYRKVGTEHAKLSGHRNLNPDAPALLKSLEVQSREISDQIQALNANERLLTAELSRFEQAEQDHAAATAVATAAALEQAKREDRSFWFRRFHTSLAIANGAGFAAVSSKLFDPTLTAATAGYAFYPMGAFAIGMVLAGLIPVALYRDAGRWAWGLAGASALLFCGALVASLMAVWRQTGWPFP